MGAAPTARSGWWSTAVQGRAWVGRPALCRDLNIREDDDLDQAQLEAWVKQAGRLPGERL